MTGKRGNPNMVKGGPSLNPGGRPKDALSLGRDLVQSIHKAFETVGKEKYLVDMALEDRKTFAALIAKVIPSEVNQTVQHTVIDLGKAMEQANKRLEHMNTLIDVTPTSDAPSSIDDTTPEPVEDQRKWR